MPFDWMHPSIPTVVTERLPERALAVRRQEIRERAALLMRLGRTREQAAARCRQNLRWDYDLSGEPALLSEVDALVEEVYRRTLTLDPRG